MRTDRGLTGGKRLDDASLSPLPLSLFLTHLDSFSPFSPELPEVVLSNRAFSILLVSISEILVKILAPLNASSHAFIVSLRYVATFARFHD